jgi:hypothetical protein
MVPKHGCAAGLAPLKPAIPDVVTRDGRNFTPAGTTRQIHWVSFVAGWLSAAESSEYKGGKLTVCHAGPCQTARTLHPISIAARGLSLFSLSCLLGLELT